MSGRIGFMDCSFRPSSCPPPPGGLRALLRRHGSASLERSPRYQKLAGIFCIPPRLHLPSIARCRVAASVNPSNVCSRFSATSFFPAQMLAAATRLQDTAVSLFPVFLFFFIAFGGFIVRIPTLPGYLRSWAPTISFVRWAMEVCACGGFDPLLLPSDPD